jgi:uncharacterized protein YecE (DUF72 family)
MIRHEVNKVRIGVAGWSIPRALRLSESARKSLLEQYCCLFNATEINSSFYRPHRFETYQRWGASVPDHFRFAVKVPKRFTHERRLIVDADEILAFMTCVRGLGDKFGALLVQLPPSGLLDEMAARVFFGALTRETLALIVCEARHPSWFTPDANQLLDELHVVRVTADPMPRGCEFSPSNNIRSTYLRLHGSPHIYYSPYAFTYLEQLSSLLGRANPIDETWCIFDNTAAGAAWSDAQTLQRLLHNQPRLVE